MRTTAPRLNALVGAGMNQIFSRFPLKHDLKFVNDIKLCFGWLEEKSKALFKFC